MEQEASGLRRVRQVPGRVERTGISNSDTREQTLALPLPSYVT